MAQGQDKDQAPTTSYRRKNSKFGDGAGAVVVGKGTGVFASYNNSAGNLEALKAPAIGKMNENHYLSMAGQEVFKFAIKVIPESINAVLRRLHRITSAFVLRMSLKESFEVSKICIILFI